MKRSHNNKRWIFYIIAVCIPIAILLLIEATLRLINYGQDVALFIDNPANQHYQVTRPDILKAYFAEQAELPSVALEPSFLLKQKPSNGLRIVVQGGSTAAGFPYGMGASIAGILDQRMRQTFPQRYVEVINTAMSAVNSYSLLDMADEIIDIQPDAVFIYAGHNEYLGILGVGSSYAASQSYWLTRSMLWLNDWRIFQFVRSLTFAILQSSAPTESENTAPRTFMAKVAKHKNIPLNSTMYEAGLLQFERNMRALLAKYRANNIPVYIATVASNLSDQAPFASAALNQEQEGLLNALQNQERPLTEASIAKISDKINASNNAQLHYEFAQIMRANKQFSLAKVHFIQAKEHDLLRFRAPEAINKIIARLAQDESFHLVPAYQALAKRSPNGIIGEQLMLEHLHPNLQGYYVVANSFYDSFFQASSIAPKIYVDINRAWQQRLVLPSEEYLGFATIQKLKADYPFVSSPQQIKLPRTSDWQQELGLKRFNKTINWLEMMENALQRYQQTQNHKMANKTTQILADAMPHHGLYNQQTADIMMKQMRLSEALYYYQRAKLAGAIGLEVTISQLQTRTAK